MTNALAHGIYKNFLTRGYVDLEGAYAAGMLRKSQLSDGGSYTGYSRNAYTAVWNATTQRFTYLRHKYGSSFFEEIRHPEDDNGFDVFAPIALIKDPE